MMAWKRGWETVGKNTFLLLNKKSYIYSFQLNKINSIILLKMLNVKFNKINSIICLKILNTYMK